MQKKTMTRRRLLQAVGALPLAFGGYGSWAAGAPPIDEESRPSSAAEALERLKAGNRRFADGRVRHAHEAADWRKQLATAGQQPFATIVGCSDSRVPIELVFDQGFGDLFVIRVAGNVIADDVIGSIGFAVRHLKTPLLVILGHERCGAVTAALGALAGKNPQPKYIQALLKHVEPALQNLDPKLDGDARLAAAVEANVRWSAHQLSRLPEAQQFREEKLVTMVSAVYELQTGTVRFLE